MLNAVIVLAIAPAFLILVLGIVARVVAAQRVRSLIVQYAPERGSTVLRDALLVNADRRAASAALIDLAVKRKIRLVTDGSKRDPIGVEMMPNVVLAAEEVALLEALFGPEHTPGRVRRFSSDRRALSARLKSVVQNVEHALARDGLTAERRTTWPGTTLTVLAYLGMLVEALFIVFALVGSDWPALVATVVALVATIATIIVTPASWRRFLPPARARREHLDGLRQYLELAEADRMRKLQSPSGAELAATDAPEAAEVRQGEARRGEVRQGEARQGEARRGEVQRGEVRQGDAPVTDGPGSSEFAAPAARGASVANEVSVPDVASAALARFHLHERLLPYAVLFGLEREWISALKLEAAALDRTNLDTLGDLVDVTADIATAIDAAGGVVELTAAVGDLVDGAGGVIDGVGGIFELFGS